MANIAWIGMGNMGVPLAEHLRDAGHSVAVYDINPAKYAALDGMRPAASPADAARDVEFIFTTVPDPAALKACILGKDGVASVLREGQIVVDMSTVSIAASAECDEAVKEKGAAFLCAPVAGGAEHAREARLLVMCSGPKGAYDRAEPLFAALSRARYYLGEGYGARALKLAHNLMIAVNMQMLAESLAFCEKAGVDRDAALDVIGQSALMNPYLKFKLPEIRDRSFALTSMPVRMLAKDLRLTQECMDGLGIPAPVTTAAKQMLDALNAQGYGEHDPSWLVLQMEKIAGLDPAEWEEK